MKYLSIIFCFALSSFFIFAQRPILFSGNFKGEKMWDTRKMQTYGSTVSLDIEDSIIKLKYHSLEQVDTFVYLGIYNNGFRYERKKNSFSWGYLWLSRDTLKLQIGEPGEVNYFYNLSSYNKIIICPECLGKKKTPCPRCQGIGRISGEYKCWACNGAASITKNQCNRCRGLGVIKGGLVWLESYVTEN